MDPQGHSWRSPYRTKKILDYTEIEVVKVNHQQNKYHVVPTIRGISKQNLFQIFHQCFGYILIARLWNMAKEFFMKGLPKHLPRLGDPFIHIPIN